MRSQIWRSVASCSAAAGPMSESARASGAWAGDSSMPGPARTSDGLTHTVRVPWAECDPRAVVFNAHYLERDDASSASDLARSPGQMPVRW